MKSAVRRTGIAAAFALCALSDVYGAPPRAGKTENIVFVMADGLRWQEAFRGADPELMTKENGAVQDVDALKKTYWRESPQERRSTLMPFLWNVIGKRGQIYGNRAEGSEVSVANQHNFSYPGYNETLCGFPDPRVDSNDKIPNPNVTVFEWLHRKPAYRGRVAAFGAWDVFPFIFNAQRAGFVVNAGYEPLTAGPISPRLDLLNTLKNDVPHAWEGEPPDALPFHTALEYLKAHQPRLLFLSLGETDEWAHSGDYAQYLHSAHRADDFIKTLWETVQSMEQYRGKTTLIVSVDHGRGEAPLEWKDHGEKIPDSKYIWMAFLGPDTPALGERKKIPAFEQNQIAATLAALLGEDYAGEVKKAGRAVADVLQKERQ